ncbi:hypothetical protein GCM10009837_29520 [Streptomyces durmitorensis]|uniref:Xaa-Pro dipeptidyl-peptidase C-terminal domain-containing protein n=1 Tax=Streptomyces durmitorensis TaxID=319947 RepID=A0ABY4PY19_9ACTN|nr:CocE/NonD family hydrolase C-terminal non-catalytic domain-containing protein [Streptomyces durmitorensis]UQT58712.1 hypothetical protein M4V62_28630 [Streptomyces durmitorensis]
MGHGAQPPHRRDITAKPVDVFPDGRAINLCDGILRLRYRNSLSEPELMTPGEVYEVTVPMSVTSNVFLFGHRPLTEQGTAPGTALTSPPASPRRRASFSCGIRGSRAS